MSQKERHGHCQKYKNNKNLPKRRFKFTEEAIMSIQDGVTLGELSRLAKLLTVTELARELDVHPDTIRRWTKKGRISCIRHPINNYRLFLMSDLIIEVMKNEKKCSPLRARIIERTRA